MEKASQLELFSQGKDSLGPKAAARPFWSCIRGYEKAITAIICAIVIAVVSYSLGVERGRRLEFLKANSRLDMAARVTIQPQVQQPAPVIEKQSVITDEPGGQLSANNYTIQVASYRTRAIAQKEAGFLRKKGLSCVLLSKGGYVILCVGNFPNKEKARIYLAQLRKTYKDCFIRRL